MHACVCVFWFVDYNDWGEGGVVVMMPKEQDACVGVYVCVHMCVYECLCECVCVEGRVYIEMLQV